MKLIAIPSLLLLAALTVDACGASQHPLDLGDISFSQDVKPLFDRHCVVCHGDRGGVSLESHQAIMNPTRQEPVVVPGKPERSPLVQAIEQAKMPAELPDVHDPLGGSPLTDRELHILRLWVRQGAMDN